MAKKESAELQKLSQALAKKVRERAYMNDALCQLLTIFHERLKLLEEKLDDE